MNIGSQVKTADGYGIIVGKEQPEERCCVWLVQLKDGRESYYFTREIEEMPGR